MQELPQLPPAAPHKPPPFATPTASSSKAALEPHEAVPLLLALRICAAHHLLVVLNLVMSLLLIVEGVALGAEQGSEGQASCCQEPPATSNTLPPLAQECNREHARQRHATTASKGAPSPAGPPPVPPARRASRHAAPRSSAAGRPAGQCSPLGAAAAAESAEREQPGSCSQ